MDLKPGHLIRIFLSKKGIFIFFVCFSLIFGMIYYLNEISFFGVTYSRSGLQMQIKLHVPASLQAVSIKYTIPYGEWIPNPDLDEKGHNYDNISGFPETIISNIVHYVLFSDHQLSHNHYLSLKSVMKHQTPDLIIIHCDCYDLSGHYWSLFKNETIGSPTAIDVRFVTKPMTIFSKVLALSWSGKHAIDITKLRALSQSGGIYLDNNILLKKPLTHFMRFEMTLNWNRGSDLDDDILVAHKKSRFLKLWLDSYKHYVASLPYFNSRLLPTRAILEPFPFLVHRVEDNFKEYITRI